MEHKPDPSAIAIVNEALAVRGSQAEKPPLLADHPDFDIEFYGGLGLAITQWANVERAMFMLLCASLRDLHPRTVNAIFYGAQTMHAKRELVTTTLATEKASPEEQEEWRRLSEVVRKLTSERNKLAHWVAIGFKDHKHLRHPVHIKSDDGERIVASDFPEMWRQFNEVADQIDALQSRVMFSARR
jgi:hypothetical protein